jgi:hypothetical protein
MDLETKADFFPTPFWMTDIYNSGGMCLLSSRNRIVKCKCKAIPVRTFQAQRNSEGWGSQISRKLAHEGVKVVNPTNQPSLPPYSMQQSPSWEANQCLKLVKKFSAFLWNPKVLYRTHKCPPPVPILSQLHLVPITPSNFLELHLNFILLSTYGSPQWPLSFRFPHQHPVYTSLLPHTRHMPRPSHFFVQPPLPASKYSWNSFR